MADLGTARGEIQIAFDPSGVGQAVAGLSQLQRTGAQTAAAMQGAGLALGGLGAAILAPLGLAVKAAADFESAMAGVNAVMDLQGTQFQDLSDLATQLGKDTIFSSTEAAQGIETLGKAGIGAEDILNGAAEAATNLAAAGGISVPEAAHAMAAAMNEFGVAGSDAATVADMLAGAASSSLADVSDLATGLAQVGGTAAALGVPLEEVITELAVMTDNGLSGSDAATSLKTALNNLVAPIGAAADEQERLGLSFRDSTGEFMGIHDSAKLLVDTYDALGLSEADQLASVKALAGPDGYRALLFAMDAVRKENKDGAKGWDDYSDAVNEAGAAQKIAQARMDSLEGSIEKLKGTAETLGQAVGESLLAPFRSLVDGLNAVLQAITGLPPGILALIATIAGISGGLLVAGGAALVFASQILKVQLALEALGLSLGGVLLAVAALTAAIILLGLAWQNNWFGIRDKVTKAADDMGNAIQKAGDIFKQVSESGTARGLNDTSAAILGLGAAARSMGVDITPVTTKLSNFAQEVGLFFDIFRGQGQAKVPAAINAVAAALKDMTGIDLTKQAKGLALFEGRLESLVNAILGGDFDTAGNVFRSMLDQIGTSIQDALSQVDIGQVTVNILDWIITSAVDVATRIKEFLFGGPSTTPEGGGAPIDHPGVFVNILDWFVTSAVPFLERVKAFLFGGTVGGGAQAATNAGAMGGAASGTAIEYPGVAVHVMDWIVSTAVDFFTKVKEFLFGGGNAQAATNAGAMGGGAVVEYPGVAVQVMDWFVSAAVDFLAKVKEFLFGGTNAQASTNAGAMGGSAAIDYPGVPVRIMDWIVSEAVTFVEKVKLFLFGGTEAVTGGAPIEHPGVAVQIMDWFITAATDLGTAIKEWALGGGNAQAATNAGAMGGAPGASGGALVELASIGVHILGWAITAVMDLFTAIKNWALGGGDAQAGTNAGAMGGAVGGGGALVEIGSVAVSILDWLISAAKDIGTAIHDFVLGTGGGNAQAATNAGAMGGTAGVPIDSVAVNILDWVISAAKDIGTTIGTWIDDNIGEVTIGTVTIGGLTIEVGPTSMTNALATLKTSIQTAINNADIGTLDFATFGSKIGAALRSAIDSMTGQNGVIGKAIGDAFTGEGGGADIPTQILDGIKGALANPLPAGVLDEQMRTVLGDIAAVIGGAIAGFAWGDEIDFETAAENLRTAFSDFVTNVFTGQAEIPGLQDGVTSLVQQIAESISGLDWSAVGTAISDGLKAAASGITDLSGIFDTLAAQIPLWIQIGLTKATGGFGAIITEIGNQIAAAPMDFAAAGAEIAKNIIDSIVTGIQAGAGAIASAISDAVTGGTESGGIPFPDAKITVPPPTRRSGVTALPNVGAGPQLPDMSKELADQVAAFQKAGEDAGKAFQNGLNAGLQAATSALGAFAQAMTAQLATLATGFGTAGQTAGTSFQTGLNAGMQAATSALGAFISSMTAQLQAFAATATQSGTAAGQGFTSGLSGGMQAAIGAVQSAVSSIQGILDSAAAGAFSAGAAVGQGFADGIASAQGAVDAAAANLAASAAAAIASAAQIASPSKVTQALGQDFGAGFELGISDMLKDAMKAGAALSNSALSGLNSQHAGERARQHATELQSQAAMVGRNAWENAMALQQRAASNLEATVVIDGGGMTDFVLGTAFGPLRPAHAVHRRGGRMSGAPA